MVDVVLFVEDVVISVELEDEDELDGIVVEV